MTILRIEIIEDLIKAIDDGTITEGSFIEDLPCDLYLCEEPKITELFEQKEFIKDNFDTVTRRINEHSESPLFDDYDEIIRITYFRECLDIFVSTDLWGDEAIHSFTAEQVKLFRRELIEMLYNEQ